MSSSNQEKGGRPRAFLRAAGSRGAAVAAIVVAMLVAVSSMTSATAATAIVIGGLGATSLSDGMMKLALGQKFTGVDPDSETAWQRKAVTWPAQAGPMLGTVSMGESVSVGTANMLSLIRSTYATTGGGITVFGMSEGSAVVDEVMRALAKDPSAPPPSALNFIVAGDANHRQAGFIPHTYGGYKFQEPATTPYNLTVVTYEYDGWSDWPDNLWNWTAARNALAGAVLLHNKSYYVDLETVPLADITKKQNTSGGITTYYLVRTDVLPLVVMNPRLARQAAELRAKIDAAYSRNNPVPAKPSTTAAVSTSRTTALDEESSGDNSANATHGSEEAAAPTGGENATASSNRRSWRLRDKSRAESTGDENAASSNRGHGSLRDRSTSKSGSDAAAGPIRNWLRARQERADSAADNSQTARGAAANGAAGSAE